MSNSNSTRFGSSAFGSFSHTLQVLFDEALLDGTAAHESWSHAWGRAVAYAWESQENKSLLLEKPLDVLAKFNYVPPAGVDIRVIDANRDDDISFTIEKNEKKVSYSKSNLASGRFKAYLVDAKTVIADTENDGFVSFSLVSECNDLYKNETKVWNDIPVNGWVSVPSTGLVVKHPSGNLWFVTTEEIATPKSIDEAKSIVSQTMDEYISSNPAYLNLSSTIIMKLPPAPEKSSNMALMDYDALGKIYPFTT
ncbi:MULTISPECIES: hypothetical protein [Pseudoalteromonas]|uniref:Uncharacterized protein n=1 Tax=Pseudoalteromonas aurantia 208 TaxID=1314867 RepID=A0ABR9EKH7_9GAMM|nr:MULTISPECIES: hypothetical protein [Pseudoalteromonas]MBE0370760.1 hypothetical protein [Pseudoalteromonas aurantia 208]MBQ4845426.1 hypothetical protein [Pseudoalteromonas sp. MMG005]